MSDFKTNKDFRKGRLADLPYQDPTFLSFVLLFDFGDSLDLRPDSTLESPLLVKDGALKYYDKLIANAGDDAPFFEERKEALQNFITALRDINTKAPWYWQGLSGVEKLLQYDTSNPYFGGDDSKLTISTLESINLAISGLMHLYRKAVWDEHKWSWILPQNLRFFRMYVYVTEIRAIRQYSGEKSDTQLKNYEPITGEQHRPYFMFSLGHCEFDITSGTSPFADLSKNPEGQAANEIVISYEMLHQVQSRALNGIVKTEYNLDKLSPAPDFEAVIIEQPNANSEQSADPDSLAKSRLANLAESAVDDLKRLSQDKKAEIEQFIRNNTVNKFQNPGNVFKNFVRRLDNATDINQQTRNLGVAVQQNVYGVSPGDTIGDALKSAARDSLGNVYN